MTRLYRSTRDRVMTGLAGGLSDTLGIDSTLLRILLIVSIFVTAGMVIPVYFVAALIIPKEQGGYPPYGSGHRPGGYGHPYSGPGYGPGPEAYGPEHQGPYGRGPQPQANPRYAAKQESFNAADTHLDQMMKDIEKKAMQKEIEELKRKLAKYENEKGEV